MIVHGNLSGVSAVLEIVVRLTGEVATEVTLRVHLLGKARSFRRARVLKAAGYSSRDCERGDYPQVVDAVTGKDD